MFSRAVLYEVKALVMTLLEESLLPLGAGLLLLAMLLREVLLILLGVLVRGVVVARGVGLRDPKCGQAEGRGEKDEADASRFHGLTVESGLAARALRLIRSRPPKPAAAKRDIVGGSGVVVAVSGVIW